MWNFLSKFQEVSIIYSKLYFNDILKCDTINFDWMKRVKSIKRMKMKMTQNYVKESLKNSF